jgi:lipoprotein-anchoring transpeptidase ErfK/SrfK
MTLKPTSPLWPFVAALLLCRTTGAEQAGGDRTVRDGPPPSDALKAPAPRSDETSGPKKTAKDSTSEPIKETGLPRSVLVKRDHTIVRIKSTQKARRRGVVMKGARLPVTGSSTGFGCKGPWYQVHGDGWICGQEVVLSTLAPGAPEYPVVPEGQLTPWPYGFVREDTLEYRVNDGALEEVREVFKGFGFGIKSRFRIDEDKFFRTAEDTLIPRGAAGMTDRISQFRGMALEAGKPWPVGFVHSRRAYAYSAPSRAEKHRLARVERYKPFEVLEVVGKGKKRFVRFDEGAYLAWTDVRVATAVTPPKGVKPGERWIDVDTTQQIMTAYEGETPVYLTLVSTGRYGGSRTVKGVYRIWAKISAIAMDNTDEELEDEAAADAGAPGETAVAPARKLYSLHDVPWTQFFHESYALHGVYWHDSFGNRRSHGCVNLSPADARWFYRWTTPAVPDGWWAVHSTDADPGTLVRVR